MAIASFLTSERRIGKVYYPGLPSHPDYTIAREQMTGGFGGVLSFEVKSPPDEFLSKLQLIKRAVSLGGVESTITSPARTSHVSLSAAQRDAIGVTDNLLRLSVGIEESTDLIDDIQNALD
jgi:cystathionine beta-lyase/cystathionine gamma-synthase